MSENTEKKTPPVGVRILLSIISILLCIGLFASLLVTVCILDFRLITSKATIQKAAGSLLCAPVPHSPRPMAAAVGAQPISAEASATQTQDALVEWLYGTLKEQHGDELVVTQEQMQAFLDQSTTKEFLTEKIASYMDDFINGTSNTTLTNEELSQLIEENMTLIEAELGIVMDDAAKEQVYAFVEKTDLDNVIRHEVIESIENVTIPGAAPLFPENIPTTPGADNAPDDGGYTVGAMMADLRRLTSVNALIIWSAIILVLIIALFFTNRLRLGATLCCVGLPATVAGLLLSLPTLVLQLVPGMLPSPLGSTVSILVGVVAPVHYILLGIGIVALIIAAVARSHQKK